MVITSLDNEKVKYYYKLQKKKYRDLNNEFIVEGEHLVLEAYKAGILKEVLLEEGEVLPIDIEQVEVTRDILKKISSLASPPKMIGLCDKIIDTTIGKRILILDEIQELLESVHITDISKKEGIVGANIFYEMPKE